MNFLRLALVLVVAAAPLRAQDEAQIAPSGNVPAAHTDPQALLTDNDRSPYHLALIAYKAGDYEKALDALKNADAAAQDDNFIILKARILTELTRYDEADKVLAPRAGSSGTPETWSAMGDLDLRRRNFTAAMKYYDAARSHATDRNIPLKLVYCEIGAGDLVDAGKLASTLSPFDSKNPYDDNASYYFARAALAQATGKTSEAEDDIQSARTDFGITVTNRYLRDYLQFFSAPDKNANTNITPPPKK